MQRLVIIKNGRDASVTDVRLGVTLILLCVRAPRLTDAAHSEAERNYAL